MAEAEKLEYRFEIGPHGECISFAGAAAAARVAGSTALLRQGQVPGAPDLGLGLQDLKYQPQDDLSLTRVTQDYNAQLSAWVPSDSLREVGAQLVLTPDGREVVGLHVQADPSRDAPALTPAARRALRHGDPDLKTYSHFQ